MRLCSIAVVAALGAAVAAPSHADGGRVLLSEPLGASQVTVFLAPSPVRVGPADVTVLIQAGEGGAAVLDARVELEMVPVLDGSPPPTRLPALRGAATNQLLYGAQVDLFRPGAWRLRADVARGDESGSVETTFDVAPPAAPVTRYWPWLAIVPAVVAVFLLHQWLRDRQKLRE
ncbi:MAG: hypothetical protein FJ144_04420 [Deltaproteobacteria bacterium]|nr:hypothetical protein [Deltaproteobacteria bacterium]